MVIYDDGIQLNAVLEKPEGVDFCPLVILLHGFTSAMDRPHNLLAAAAMRDAGFATLRFDLYGHGTSGGEFRKHTIWKWISNTMAVIDHCLELGYTEVYLSGHSQGAQCARDGNLLGQRIDPDHIPDSLPTIKGLTLDGNYVRVAQTIRVEDAADRFRNPILILHGDEDDTVPLADSHRMAQLYRNCELTVIAGETHHFDRHPDQMQEAIRTWLTGR